MIPTRLRELRERAGLSMQALADRVGTSAPQISKLEKGERRMTLDWLSRLAEGLGVGPGELLPALAGSGRREPIVAPPAGGSAEDVIPVRRAALAEGGDMTALGEAAGFVARPPVLRHVRDAYSIYMLGTAMAPRFREGQLLYVNPHKPPQPGAGIVIRNRHDGLLIRDFAARDGALLHVRRYRPDEQATLPLDGIAEIHTIVALDEP